MQTFLPYADFARTAEVLDRTRLGKQRVECIQIVRALTIPTYGWRHHPAALMWRGHLEALGAYSFAIIEEWTGRGIRRHLRRDDRRRPRATPAWPAYAAGRAVVRRRAAVLARRPGLPLAHQSALVRKDPDHYGPLFPGVPDDLPYVWPSPDEPDGPTLGT